MIANGFRRRASPFWVSGLSPFPQVAHGRSGSATRAATRSADVMISASPNGSPGRKPARLILAIDFDVADDVGGGLGMPGIENTAQLFVVLHEAVGLIDQ